MLQLGINKDISNKDYHSDREYLSSSGIKLLHSDPEEFHRQYILGEKTESSNQTALDFGTAAHTMILEPHLFNDQVLEYTGGSRRTNDFRDFKAAHPEKLIFLPHEMEKLSALKAAFQNHPQKGLLENSLYEHTLCSEISGVKVKCRADSICPERGIITDIKTTSYASGLSQFKETLQRSHYEISAALYCIIAEQIYGKPFSFYFIVLSKDDLQCHIYKTSFETLELGKSRTKAALEFFKQAKLTNEWKQEILETEDILEV